ncbi:MAG: biotin--[acetyl-CoA-carboxylase] ligase [Saprospiraceae bacterium]
MGNLDTALFIGKTSYHFETLPSTNSFATELLSLHKPAEGTIIVAENQTAGRGQLAKLWESEPNKNITMSVILYPTFLHASENIVLNQSIALGVHDFIQTFVKNKIKIKWPNDIYIGNKKISGILIQNSLQGELIQHSIIGIGINVNQTQFEAAENPTSLALETEATFDLSILIAKLCYCLEYRYLQLKNRDFATIKHDYHSQLHQLKENKEYMHLATSEVFTGSLQGINEEGKLLINTDKGVQIYNLHEIKFL